MTNKKNIYEDLLKRKGGRRVHPKDEKKNNTKDYYVKQTKSKSKEILVKVTTDNGNSKGHVHTRQEFKDLLNYLVRGSDNKEIYTNTGLPITKDRVEEIVEICSEGFIESPTNSTKKNRLVSQVIISIPNDVASYSKFKKYNDKKLKNILEKVSTESISEKYPMNDFFLSVHDNGKNLHIHVPVVCKGHDGYKISINKPDIQELREKLVYKLKEYDINLVATSFLDKNHEKSPKKQKIHMEHNINLGDSYKIKVPKWCNSINNIENYSLDSSKFKSKKEENKFNELFKIFQECYTDRNKAIKSFLLMYKEDKRIATWSLDKNPKIFGELKDKKIKIPPINIRYINTELVVDKSISLDR
ncbi:MAG: hypothetical protein LBH40_03130 [Alphaproteobacteria bacterium]|jgi:hypothetical protein|nr:hypothetical protein [Alphaproteobacteria bacterium]